MMTREVFQGLVRHALTVAGGALAARWGWSGEVVDALVGAGAILAGAYLCGTTMPDGSINNSDCLRP